MNKEYYKLTTDKEIFRAIWEWFNCIDHYVGYGSNMSSVLGTISNTPEIATHYIKTTHVINHNCDDYIIMIAGNANKIKNTIPVRQTFYNKLSKHNRDILNVSFYQSPGKFSSPIRDKHKLIYYDKFVDLTALGFFLSSFDNINDFENSRFTSEQIENVKSTFLNVISELTYLVKQYQLEELNG